MSRIGAQRVVNNFSGGLVTEANQLTFPENSLSEAYNVELGVDGSIQTRGAFDSFTGSMTINASGFPDFRNIAAVKKFYWKEKKATLVAYIVDSTIGGVLLALIKNDGSMIWAEEGVPPLSTASSEDLIKYFDVGFSADEFLFSFKYDQGGYSRTTVYSGRLSDDESSLILSDPYDPSISSSVREPAEGSYYEGGSGGPAYYYGFGRGLLPYWEGTTIYWDGVRVFNATQEIYPSVSVGEYTYHVKDYVKEEIVGENGVVSYYSVYRTSSSGVVEYSDSAQPIRYRDFNGVPNPDSEAPSINHSRPPSYRPEDLSAFSAYNLYNAGWPISSDGLKHVTNESATSVSTAGINLVKATKETAGVYPSMCDAHYDFTVDQGSADAIGLYSPLLLKKSPVVSQLPRKGSHILKMGYEFLGQVETSTAGAYFYPREFYGPGAAFYSQFFDYASEQASKDVAITSVSIIGGRAWYGIKGRGFNIAYSQINYLNDNFVSKSVGNYANCHQLNDPNSEVINDILDTDGGTISISEIGDIFKIVEYRNHILVFAENGVWSISGNESVSFKPTSYTIQKVSEDGVSRGEGVISTDDGVFYISREDLKVIILNQSGVLTVSDVSETKIKSKMFEVAREFNSSVNACLVLDRENKRLHINYTKPVNGFSSASNSLKLAGQSYSLVFDMRLGSFYEWELSYDNKTAMGENLIPGISYSSDYTTNYKIDLGLIYDDKDGMCALFQNGVVTGEFLLTLRMGRTLYKYKQNYGLFATIDGGSLTRGFPRFPVSFEVPFDLVGDMTLSKSVQTMHIFQDANTDYFGTQTSGDGSITFFRPEIYMSTSWDWDSSYSNDQEIAGNIQYPEVQNYSKKKVLINKVRVPGSGRCLSLRFRNRTDGQLFGGAFKLLAYHLDINADARP